MLDRRRQKPGHPSVARTNLEQPSTLHTLEDPARARMLIVPMISEKGAIGETTTVEIRDALVGALLKIGGRDTQTEAPPQAPGQAVPHAREHLA